MLAPRYQISPTPNLLILWAFLTALAVVVLFYITIPLTPQIAEEYGISLRQVGLGVTSFGLAYACGLLVFGPLSDKYGRVTIIFIGLWLLSAATFFMARADSYSAFLSLRALQGFVAAMIPAVILALHSDHLPPQLRTRGIALTSFAFLSSAPLVQLWMGGSTANLSQGMNTLWPLFIISALVVPWFRLKKRQPLAAGSTTSETSPLSSSSASSERSPAKTSAVPSALTIEPSTGTAPPRSANHRLLRNPIIICCWLSAATVLFSYTMFQTGFPIFWRASSSLMASIKLAALLPLPLTIAAGFIIPLKGPVKVSICGLSLGALACVLGMWQHPIVIVLCSALLSAGISLAVPGLIALTSYHSQPENRGLALAVYSFILFLGASLATPLAQWLSDHSYALWMLVPACALGSATVLITFGAKRVASH